MKYARLTSLLFVLACSQDLSKLKNSGDATGAGSSGSSAAGSVIILNKSNAIIPFGSTDQLYASVLPDTQTVTWSSLNTSVATVSGSGLVTATGSGQTQIIAVLSGSTIYAGCSVTVPAGSFTANPADNATVETLNSIVITYSEAMNAAALNASNYTLSGAGKGTLSTNPLSLSRSGNIYTLLFAGSPANGAIVLTINNANVKTQGGVTLTGNTVNYTTYGWYTFLGGVGSDTPNSIQQTNDGGYIVAGYAAANIANLGGQTPLNAYASGNDILVIKLNVAGAVSWYTFLGGTGSDVALSIQQTADGGYIVAGAAGSSIANLGGQAPLNAYAAGNDALVIKLTAAGAVSWFTFVGGAGTDVAFFIQQTADGGYIVANNASANVANLGGQTPLNAYAAGNDFLVIKMSAAGVVAWYTFLGGAAGDIATSLQQTADGGYIVAGYAFANIATLGGQTPLNAYAASNDMVVIKLTAAGAVSWYTFLGGSGGDIARTIKQTADGGYIVIGDATANMPNLGGQTPISAYAALSDILVLKLTDAGAVSWYTFLGGAGNDTAAAGQQTSDGGFIIAGSASANIATLGVQTPINAYTAGIDSLVLRLTAIGAVSWYTFLGSSAADSSQAIIQTADGGYVVALEAAANIASLGGQTPLNAYTTGNDMLFVRLKSNGRL